MAKESDQKETEKERDSSRDEGGERGHSEGDKEKRQERKLNALKRFEYYVCRVVATYRDSVEGRGQGGEYLRGGRGTGERQLSCITNAQREDVAFDQSRHFAVSVVVVVACVTAVCCCSCCGHCDLF